MDIATYLRQQRDRLGQQTRRVRDFSVFAQFWLRDDCGVYNYYCDWADLDFDGDVDFDDLDILIDYWLEIGIYK